MNTAPNDYHSAPNFETYAVLTNLLDDPGELGPATASGAIYEPERLKNHVTGSLYIGWNHYTTGLAGDLLTHAMDAVDWGYIAHQFRQNPPALPRPRDEPDTPEPPDAGDDPGEIHACDRCETPHYRRDLTSRKQQLYCPECLFSA
jgi:hypothetical protein